MKSDPIFYELFQAAPQTFFELIQRTPPCAYTFKSVTVKSTEKRIDGILEPSQAGQPIYFVEVQAYKDNNIYWRTLREIATYFEQANAAQPWQAFVLWLNKKDDKGFSEVTVYDKDKQQRLHSIYLLDVLKTLNETSLIYNVLQPLLVDDEAQVRYHFPEWVQNIHQSDVGTKIEQRLLMVLTQLIEQKFKRLTYKELAKMLKLVPLRELGSVREVIEEELQVDRVSLLTKLIRRKFKFADSTIANLRERLQKLPLDALEELFEEVIDMETLREIKAWVSARTPRELKQQ